MSSWGNNDNAANAPYWAVNSTIVHNAIDHATPDATNVAFLYGNTSPDAYVTGETIGLFMVDTAELTAGGDKVTGVSVIQGGSGYVEVPGVSFSGGGGASAAATAVVTGGVITGVTVTNIGSSYETVPTVTIQVPVMTIATSAVTTGSNTISYTAHAQANGAALVYANNSSTTMAGLTNGTTYYAIPLGDDTLSLATSAANAANNIQVDITGTGNNGQYFTIVNGVRATATATKGLDNDYDGNTGGGHVPHQGWVLKTTGTGGRAGRVQYETLVALSEPKLDGSDDITLPDA